MRYAWHYTLALTLGAGATFARAGDGAWAPPAAPPSNQAPAAVLERPIPLPADPAVQPTAYSTDDPSNPAPPVVRAQAPDLPAPRPLPVGPAVTQAPGIDSWRRWPGDDVPVGPLAPTVHGAIVGPQCMGDGCGACPMDCNECLPPGNRFYTSTDYLLWWVKGSNTPVLVTRGSAGDPTPGALGLPGTSVLFGGRNTEDNPFSGVRTMVGYWFSDDHALGIEAGGFILGQQGKNFSATSNGGTILTRPFVDATTGLQTTELVAGPNVLAGTVSVNTQTQLWGYEANLRSNFLCGSLWGGHYYTDALIGFRGLGLDDSVDIHESLVILGGNSAGGRFEIEDRFEARNRFYGGQVGFVNEYRNGNWIVDLKTKFAIGAMQEQVNINGSTTTIASTGTNTYTGGLLTQPSNIGHYNRSVVAFMPEVGLNLGYQFTEHIRAFVGYNIIYASSVARAGQQIDTVVNPNNLPPSVATAPLRPAFTFRSTDFWTQGVNLGLEFRY
jgi:hypothetical protein